MLSCNIRQRVALKDTGLAKRHPEGTSSPCCCKFGLSNLKAACLLAAKAIDQ